jgi:ElaB/YqjD/DUF883 family membrane-anchored ribosome-binding protein
MDFSAKLENLKAKVDEVVASARAAAAEDRDQLKHRVDQAQDDANKAVADASSEPTRPPIEPRVSGRR